MTLFSKIGTKQSAFLLFFLTGSFAFSQTLSVGSGSAVLGGSLSLNVSLSSATNPAGLEWTLSYNPSDVASIAVATGPALTAASKSVVCSSSSGSTLCLATGMNANAISNGVVAVVTITLASSTSGASVPVSIGNTYASMADGTATTESGTGGTITVTNWQPPLVKVTGLSCGSLSLMTPASTPCTVTLSGAAPSGGLSVSLSANNTALTVPGSVAVAVGASTSTFTASAASVSTSQNAAITASANGSSSAVALNLIPFSSRTISGTVGAYAFNEGSGSTTADASGNGITGQIHGATWTTAGKYADALSFDGSSSYVDLGTPTAFQSTGTMSWSAWVYIAANTGTDGQIIAQSNDTAGWQLKTTYDTGPLTFGVAVWSGTAGARTKRYSTTVPSLNTWYHVAAVYNAATQSLDIYVNGVLADGTLSGTVPASQVLAPVNVTVGRRFGNYGGYYFNGVIDNLRVYNRALSAADVQTDMSTPVVASQGSTSPAISALQCSPTTILSGATTSCTVTLSQAASSGGSVVSLTSNSAALTVPVSVTLPAGSTSASFIGTAKSVTTNQSATVTASLNGTSASASLTITPTITPVTVSALQCSPTTVVSGASTACTVTLSQAAPSGGSVVNLSSNLAALTVPASVSIVANSLSASFNAAAGSVTVNTPATVTAALNGSSTTAAVTVAPQIVTVSALQCSPTTVSAGVSTSCTVTLSKPASTGGSSLALSSNSAALTVPVSVTLPAGSTSASFIGTAKSVTTNQSATVTASLNGTSASASLTITPVTVSAVQCSPATVVSGASTACTVTLSQAAPSGGSVVNLSSNLAALTVPASVSLVANSLSASFNATAGSVTVNTPATVTAALNGSSTTAAVTVAPQIVTVSALQCSPTTVSAGVSTSCTVTLSKSTSSGGSVVSLKSNNAALPVPASVTVPAGSTSASFVGTPGSVTTNQSATLTASLNGASATATVTVAPLAVPTLQCSPTTVTSGGKTSCTVTLSQSAPSSGSSVSLLSNNAVLTVPTAVTVSGGATSASFSASAGSVTSSQSASVTASLNGSSATSVVTVQPSTTSVSLAAAYGFNEGSGTTTADLSGNGNTGQIQGATWTTGKYGEALSFNGSTSYVDLANPASLQSTVSMSWTAWVYITQTTTSDGEIVAKSNDSAGWQLKTTHDTGPLTFGVAVWSGTAGARIQRYSTTVPSLNTWYHVAGVYNAAAQSLDIYVNGVLADGALKGTVPASQVLAPVNVTVGRRFGNYGSYYFTGVIDNLRIYNSSLSAAAVQTDMTTPVSASGTSGVLTASLSMPIAQTIGAKAPRLSSPNLQSQGQIAMSNAAPNLSCSPRSITAGGRVICSLRLASSAAPVSVSLASSTSQVKVPAAVLSRPNQSALTFEASIDPAASQQTATVTAAIGDTQAEDIILVSADARPILTVPGKQLAKFGQPLQFNVSAVDSTGLSVPLSASGLPAGAFFDVGSGRFTWTANASQTGVYHVSFEATNAVGQSTTAPVTIEVDSGKPVLEPSNGFACSPGALATLRGKWLAAPDSSLSDPSGSSMDLGGTKVKVNDSYVPILFSSPQQVNFLCPTVEPGTQLSLAVETDTAATDPITITMQNASPKILSLDGSGGDQGLISFADTAEIAMSRNFRLLAHPAQPGDEIVVWATGLGLSSDLRQSVSVNIGNAQALVEQVQAAPGYAGVYAVQIACRPARVWGAPYQSTLRWRTRQANVWAAITSQSTWNPFNNSPLSASGWLMSTASRALGIQGRSPHL